MNKLKIIFSILFCFGYLFLKAQNGSLSGVIIDKKTSETLIGASVLIQGTTLGASANLDGAYEIKNIPAGTYDIRISYVSYNTQVIKGVEIKAGKSTVVNGALETGIEIKEVEITAQANRQSTMTLMNTLRNTSSMSVGISQETIKRSPDRNVGEVLKRVSGLSIQENRFVVVRGLADRYNSALINGMPLSSAEPDRKSISFDIFPSNVIDNIVVTKTASPDLPGEFAGGIIQINTRDIPDENSFTVNVGTSMNSQSTFKEFKYFNRGKNDRLGLVDKSRFLPSEVPNTKAFNGGGFTGIESFQENAKYSKLFNNEWQLFENGSSPLNTSFQVSGSKKIKFKNDQSLGFIASLTQRVSQRKVYSENNSFGIGATPEEKGFVLAELFDENYILNTFLGGIFNIGFDFDKNNKITIKNLMGISTNDATLSRSGFDDLNFGGNFIKMNGNVYTNTNNFTSQLQFEHTGKKFQDKFNAGYSFSNVFRQVPDMKFVLYTAPAEDTDGDGKLDDGAGNYNIFIPPGATNYSGGRLYTKLNDNLRIYSADYKFPIIKEKHFIKAGGMYTSKERSYSARLFGNRYSYTNNAYIDSLSQVANVPQELIFTNENIGYRKITLGEITNPSDSYRANFKNQAAFLLLDNHISSKIRIIWGMRYENFTQSISGYKIGASQETPENAIDTSITTIDYLPSANLIYNLSDKHVLRLAASRTVSRPEFREISPNAFYDFTTFSTFFGNDTLVPGKIENFDFKYEFYPAPGQFFSLSLFYKNFINPIEQSFDGSSGNTYFYKNLTLGAYDLGAELEFRIKLSSIPGLKSLNYLDNFTISSNLAIIKSEVDLSNEVNVFEKKRPLQGQSPYIINAGIDYRNTNLGLGVTVLFNRIGERISSVGDFNNPNIKETPRSLLDFQVSKTFLKEKGEIRFSCNDLVNQYAIFYQDLDKNNKYEEEKDNLMQRYRYGINYGLSLSYKF